MLLLLAGLIVGQPADLRHSAHYRVPSDIVDAGGGISTSASYSHHGSFSLTGGSASHEASGITTRNSFLGQLAAPVSLTLTATPPQPEEAGSTRLQAQAILDDGTLLVPGEGVVWSILAGPILEITPSNEAKTDVVYQNTPAILHGWFQDAADHLELMVMNSDPDNYHTYSGDGMDDQWQVHYFGEANINAAPNMDPDADRQLNSFEYAVGTHPLDPASKLEVSIQYAAQLATWKNVVIHPAFASRRYSVEYRPRIDIGPFQKLNGVAIVTNSMMTITDTNAIDATRFYRVKVESR